LQRCGIWYFLHPRLEYVVVLMDGMVLGGGGTPEKDAKVVLDEAE
jgi:hypothetical protein